MWWGWKVEADVCMIAEMLTERQMFARIREGIEFAGYVKDRKAEVRKRGNEAITA